MPRLIILGWCISLYHAYVHAWINYPATGFATMSHYEIPRDFVAACGCAPASTHYPTAALSQMAYGSSRAYGPACGKCFNLTLMNTFLSNPPFYPPTPKSLVIKITDLCPLSKNGWCSATESKPNSAGNYLNFDLAFPSEAIPSDFFPSNVTLYGYTDFGVWNISYETVECQPQWAGSKEAAALGSISNQGPESVCCPADPTGSANDTCPSYSDQNGLPCVFPFYLHKERFTQLFIAQTQWPTRLRSINPIPSHLY
ncbi:RlpA-like double-psi beta-barrel-protein domain-containing protein-containing protein [Infundibulicybe gibba]|nr:RlpA-like double-psi beta-barrel-protein domain-containing protein-containing protein [Infundibulicybe gibba]